MPGLGKRGCREGGGDRAVGGRARGGCASAAEPASAAGGAARRGRRVLRAVVPGVLVAAIFGLAIPRFASYRGVWASIHAMTWPYLLLVATAAAASMICSWVTIRAVLPRLTLRQAATVNLGSSAVASTLPAGGALALGVSWAMLSSWGLSTADYVLYTLVTGIWNVFTVLGMPVLALVAMTTITRPGAVLITASATGLAILAAMVTALGLLLASQAFALRAGRALARLLATASRLAGRPPPASPAARLASFRDQAGILLTARGGRITAATLASYLTLWLVLLACLRAAGLSQAQMPWQTTLAAFTVIRLLTALPLTPGGLGVTELGLAAILATTNPPATTQITAAVLLYRALTYLPPIPLGALACLTWRLTPTPTSHPHHTPPPDETPTHHPPPPTPADRDSQLAALVVAVPVPLLPDTQHARRSDRA
jgi:putative heme transporter